jgi:membrane-bound serine protease (ClpP class)
MRSVRHRSSVPLLARLAGSRRFVGAAFVVLGLLMGVPGTSAQAAPGAVHVISLDAQINPVSERYVTRALRHAELERASLLLVEMNTPGGLLESTQRITSAFLGAQIPVAVYVTPPGSRAASAGVFITMSGHIAAMAPNTRIGAATPVSGEGGDLPEDLRQKILNDTIAYARSIAEARDRNADWAEEAVVDASVIGAREAVELNVVDLIAADRTTLLREIDGMVVRIGEREVTLQTADAPVEERPMSAIDQFFLAIADPNIALLLLSLGAIGLYFEFANPGTFLPGIAGAIFLILAFLSLGTLPLSYAGLAFVVLGLVLLGAEIFATSGGLLGIGGVISFALGALLLIDEEAAPFLEVSRPLILALTIGMGAFVLIALRGVIQVRRRPAYIGGDDLAGEVVLVRASGEVHVRGELWQARPADPNAAPLRPGSRVRIKARQGLMLLVEPVDGRPGESKDPGASA